MISKNNTPDYKHIYTDIIGKRFHHKKEECQTILEKDYQKNNNLNSSQLANHFKLSRNTMAKWKKMFQT